MRFAVLISWLVTISLGAFMLRTWLARGGLSRERAKAGGLPPQLIFGHAGLAVTGMLIWVAYLAAGTRALAWAGVGVLMVTICLGLCTVTLWTPYPARRPGERRAATPLDEPVVAQKTPAVAQDVVTDEMIERLLDDPFPGPRHRPIHPNPAVLIPVAHGFAAISTFVLAVMAATL